MRRTVVPSIDTQILSSILYGYTVIRHTGFEAGGPQVSENQNIVVIAVSRIWDGGPTVVA